LDSKLVENSQAANTQLCQRVSEVPMYIRLSEVGNCYDDAIAESVLTGSRSKSSFCNTMGCNKSRIRLHQSRLQSGPIAFKYRIWSSN